MTHGFGWYKPARRTVPAPYSAGMVDLQPDKYAALRGAIRPVAAIMERIGWERRLCDLDEAQVLGLIEAAVLGFRDTMLATAKPDRPEVPS